MGNIQKKIGQAANAFLNLMGSKKAEGKSYFVIAVIIQVK